MSTGTLRLKKLQYTNGTDALTIDSDGSLSAPSLATTGALTVGNGLSLSDGDMTFASGHGLFLGGSTSANFLDDYEEGTFDSTWTYDTDKTDTSPDETFTHAGNSYRKIGKVLFFNMKYINRSGTFSSSDAIISSFTIPFTNQNLTNVRSTIGGIAPYYLTGRYGSTHKTSGLMPTFNGTQNTATFQVYLSEANGGNYFPSFEDGYNVGSLYCSGTTLTA